MLLKTLGCSDIRERLTTERGWISLSIVFIALY